MRVSFNKTNKENAVAEPAPTAVAVAPAAESMAVGPVRSSAQLEGEFTQRDVSVPRIKIGSKLSKECEDDPTKIGQWLYDGLAVGKTIRVIITRVVKSYVEDLPYGSEEQPKRFKTYGEAVQAGCQVRDTADIEMLVECDETMDQFAALDAGGKSYAPARYTVQSSSYSRSVGIILRDAGGWLKGDLASGFYSISTEKKSNDKGSWFVPSLKADGKVPDEVRNAIREKFSV